MEYPKTENLWVRDPETHVMAPTNGYRHHGFHQVDRWLVLEKVDGMNMRVIFEPDAEEAVRVLGRTDRAQIPGDLMASIRTWATYTNLGCAFMDIDTEKLPKSVVLYGEGYGAGIQKGGHYREDKGFVLFDVLVDGHWLKWDDVCDVARNLGIETVPVLGRDMSTKDIEGFIEYQIMRPDWRAEGFMTDQPEGVIARTDPYLFDARGRRIMFKHKVRDVVTS